MAWNTLANAFRQVARFTASDERIVQPNLRFAMTVVPAGIQDPSFTLRFQGPPDKRARLSLRWDGKWPTTAWLWPWDWLDAYRGKSLDVADMYQTDAVLSCGCDSSLTIVGRAALETYWRNRFAQKPALALVDIIRREAKMSFRSNTRLRFNHRKPYWALIGKLRKSPGSDAAVTADVSLAGGRRSRSAVTETGNAGQSRRSAPHISLAASCSLNI